MNVDDKGRIEYGLLYTVYAWPNVVFPLVGGLLIDGFLGLRVAALVFATFIMAGQVSHSLPSQSSRERRRRQSLRRCSQWAGWRTRSG